MNENKIILTVFWFETDLLIYRYTRIVCIRRGNISFRCKGYRKLLLKFGCMPMLYTEEWINISLARIKINTHNNLTWKFYEQLFFPPRFYMSFANGSARHYKPMSTFMTSNTLLHRELRSSNTTDVSKWK